LEAVAAVANAQIANIRTTRMTKSSCLELIAR
jgi:hypothetical protein